MSDQATTKTLSTPRKTPLFPLGRITSTIPAHEAIPLGHGFHCLIRHVTGDWGVLSDDDKASNDRAVKDGDRILSAYPIDPAQPCQSRVWDGARPLSVHASVRLSPGR